MFDSQQHQVYHQPMQQQLPLQTVFNNKQQQQQRGLFTSSPLQQQQQPMLFSRSLSGGSGGNPLFDAPVTDEMLREVVGLVDSLHDVEFPDIAFEDPFELFPKQI